MVKTSTSARVFFRNDDIRDTLDDSLVQFTQLFIKHHLPISLAVEPANITHEVVDWLLTHKKQHPELIEIIQHGYDHNLKSPHQKMEFGGNRSYEDQLIDIEKGKALMDKYFGELWSPVFTFPYGSYNKATLSAVDDAGYAAISSKIQFTPKARMKNYIGGVLGKDTLIGRRINYHPGNRPGYHFKEFSVSVNPIKKYLNINEADHFAMNEIKNQLKNALMYTDIIGILFHHRFHLQHLDLIETFLLHLKAQDFSFKQIRELI